MVKRRPSKKVHPVKPEEKQLTHEEMLEIAEQRERQNAKKENG